MICPKCGRPVEARAVICFGCDFILDTEFLGEEILDEEQSLRPGMGGVDPAVFNLADAVILGDIDEQAQSFETSDSGFHVRESTGARLYVSGRSQAMMAPDAVPALVDENLGDVRLTPFEKHVLSFIDGKRPVEIIRMRAGLDESEVKTALATLADKGVVEVVGRALVDNDPFEETAQRRLQKPRRPSGVAGAVAAALGPLADETDRAIEEAFRTATGLSPLEASELAPPDDDENVFSSLSGDPLADALLKRAEARGPLTSQNKLSELGDESSVPSDTAFTQRPADDDLPSDADSFDVLARTSEIERSPALEERLRAAAAASSKRGGLGPMATNARRALSAPELAEILGEPGAEGGAPTTSTRAGERPSGLDSGESAGASDGFDDFGEASELDTALLPGLDSLSLSEAPGSAVFKSATGTASPPPPMVSQPDRDDPQGPHGPELASGASEESRTRTRPHLVDESSSLSSLLGDDEFSSLPELADAPLRAEAPGIADDDLGDGGDLADLVGDDLPSVEGTDTSKVGSGVGLPSQDVHSAITAAPALQVSASSSDESVDPFADLDLDESSEEEPAAAAGPEESEGAAEAPGARPIPIASAERAASDEGTAVYAQNPFAPDADAHAGGHDSGELDVEPDTSTRPVPPELVPERPSSEVSAVFELQDESSSGGASPDEIQDFYEAATEGVPASLAAAALSRGNLADAFSDEDMALDDEGDLEEEPPTARGFEAPRHLRPSPPPAEPSAPAGSPAPEGPVSSEEELIDDALIIRPASPTMQLRGASVFERSSPPPPVSAEPEGVHEDVQVSGAGVSSQETAHLERPEGLAALSEPAPSPPSPSAETALFEELSDVSSAASELSQGGAWASASDMGSPVSDASEEDLSYDDADGHSSDSTQVLSGPRRAAPPRPAPEESEAPPAAAEEAGQPPHAGSRNDPEAMREKAQRLFEDALKDFREGRIGAARMNAKLATIYDPANEEYRAALEQWGKGARRRPQQGPSYAALYDEAQEREGAGDIEGAIALLVQGAEQFPEIAAIQNRLGVLLAIHKREYDRASAFIQRAIELDPENLHYKSNLGKILSRRRQRQKRANG